MNYKELLINKDKVVMTSIELACIVGDCEEAIALNQVSYWIEKYKETSHNFKDGKYWVYNSYQKWHDDNFPFWHTSKIQRIFKSLEKKGLLLSANYNNAGFDKTKWYTIDYDKLQQMADEYSSKNERSLCEDEHSLIENEQSLLNSDCPIPEGYLQDNTNRDYSTEDTEVHTESKDSGCEVHTTVSEGNCRINNPEKSIDRYLALKEKEMDMLRRVTKIAYRKYGEGTAREVCLTISHFLDMYTQRTGKVHPILTDETLNSIADKIVNFRYDEYGHFEYVIYEQGGFQKLVDEYFDTDFGAVNGGGTNYRLPHFVSDEILPRIAQRVSSREGWH